MNERDSEIMGQLLEEASYAPTTELSKADIVIINTCSIRGKAEQKAFSFLGTLKKIKQKKPGLIVAVAGCVAQQEGKKIIERMPYVDIVLGPQNIYQIKNVVKKSLHNNAALSKVFTQLNNNYTIPAFLPSPKNKALPAHKRFVTIMQGCNNFCTYCVVPYTRGREVSRPVDDIINEIQHLVGNGVKEITLLGQNVNSYGLDKKENSITFPELLHKVAAIHGLKRLRFTTSNPKDLSEELMRIFQNIDILCPHFHLPVQSGSDSVLKRMNRKYTVASYLEKIDQLRKYCPDISITTDIIVGFPGETDEDFESTMELLENVRYHSSFSFKYSDRPHTKSAAFTDKVEKNTKIARLSRLQKRQEQITLERNQHYIGKTLEVMVEGESKNAAGQISGRTGTNHIVNFTTAPSPAHFQPGELVDVVIEEACLHSLRGKVVQ